MMQSDTDPDDLDLEIPDFHPPAWIILAPVLAVILVHVLVLVKRPDPSPVTSDGDRTRQSVRAKNDPSCNDRPSTLPTRGPHRS